jgi:hypothetical protein
MGPPPQRAAAAAFLPSFLCCFSSCKVKTQGSKVQEAVGTVGSFAERRTVVVAVAGGSGVAKPLEAAAGPALLVVLHAHSQRPVQEAIIVAGQVAMWESVVAEG